MMKSSGLLIFTNHVYPYHVGGSEIVVDKIAESLSSYIDVVVCGNDVANDCNYKNYKQVKINSNLDLIKTLNKYKSYDILIYSDGYFFTKNLFDYSAAKNKEIYLAPVGLNICRNNIEMMNKINSNKNISLIYHDTNYVDYEYGVGNLHSDRRYCVIPNGYDPSEFLIDKQLDNKINIITIANTFPYKGHDISLHILDKLIKEVEFQYHVFCATPSWIVAKNRMQWLLKEGEKRKSWMSVHVDSNRSKIIKYLKNANLMLFMSQKEVSPLVLIESCAAGVPWLSLNVGNAKSIPGGIVIDSGIDHNSNRIVNNQEVSRIIDTIKSILYGSNNCIDSNKVNEFLNDRKWQNIAKTYYEFIFKQSINFSSDGS